MFAAKPSEQTCGGRELAGKGYGLAKLPDERSKRNALRAKRTGNGHSDLSAECPPGLKDTRAAGGSPPS